MKTESCPENFTGILNAPKEVIDQAFSIPVPPKVIEQAWKDVLELKAEHRAE